MGQRDVRKPFVTFHSFTSFVLTSTAALQPPTSVHATDVIYTRPPTSVAIECIDNFVLSDSDRNLLPV